MNRQDFIAKALKNYKVTKEGKIFYSSKHRSSNRAEKTLMPHLSHDGYPKVSLSFKGEYRTLPVHRIVAQAFMGPSDLTVNHKDGDKTNNNIDNLEYVTRAENNRHYRDSVEKLPYAKLSKEDARCVKAALSLGLSNTQIAYIFDITPRYVAMIKNKQRWKNI